MAASLTAAPPAPDNGFADSEAVNSADDADRKHGPTDPWNPAAGGAVRALSDSTHPGRRADRRGQLLVVAHRRSILKGCLLSLIS